MSIIKSVIEVQEMNITINKNHILKDISFSTESGRIVVILGPNGSGKTTLLKCLKGLYKYDSGNLIKDREDVEYFKDAVLVFDEPILYEELTGNEHIRFVKELSKCEGGLSSSEIDGLIDDFELGEYMDKLICTYSLGTKKKLQFLCNLINKPDILLMDEYISGLDPEVMYVVKKVMKEYTANNKITLLSTHMLDMAEKFCDDVLLMKDGRIVGGGLASMEEVLKNYSCLEEYYLKNM